MALADTAKLIASLELQDKFSKNAALFDRTIGGMERRTSTLGKIGSEVGRGLGATAHNLGLIGVAAAGFIGANVAAGIGQLERLENAQAATNAVLKSTQGVAGQTAESIRALAEKYESLNAVIDDKTIQSGENLLLTFTNINKAAFEPALEAALNLNQALGGGEEGLQGTIIQVGKALQDPIRGLTSLRRVGVNFSEQQKKQIKDLVAQNKLYEAQQIILGELSTEFGGQFAAAGQTATGKFAKLRDTIDDAQAALATALLPVLGKVADKLTTLLNDPATIAGLKKFGDGLADGFEKAVGFAEKLPWDSIGSAFKLLGTGAKAALDAFAAAPPWLQTAVLTGWGLNKLTGGALGNIVGALGSGLIKGILGMNAGVVNINAAVVNGGGGIGPGSLLPLAEGGSALLVALTAGTLGAIALAFVASQQVPPDPFRQPTDTISPGRGFGPVSQHGRSGADSNASTAAAVREGTVPLVSEFRRSRASAEDLLRLARINAAKDPTININIPINLKVSSTLLQARIFQTISSAKIRNIGF